MRVNPGDQAPSSGARVLTGARESRRVVLVGVIVIAAVFLAQGAVNFLVTRDTQARASQLERDSILSVEQVARIGRDLEQERTLIERHISESGSAEMAEVDHRLGALNVDLRRAIDVYGPLVEQPGEAAEWRRAREAIERFETALEEALRLSRQDLDAEAHEKLVATRDEYETVDHTLAGLIEMNRNSALEAVATIKRMEDLAEGIAWAVRLIAQLVVGLVGWQLIRQVGRYENQVRDYSAQLEARNSDLDAFAGRVAHDLKNALAPIALSARLLRRAVADPKRVVEIVDRAERSTQRAVAIVDALLTFSRANGPAEASQAQVASAIAGVVEEVGPSVEHLGARLEIDSIPKLWVRCDAGLLHVLLVNLVGNAVKYLEGRDAKRVRVSIRVEGSSCRIDIADTGPGIPANALERIFEPFYRVDGTRAPGTGIGLATVRRILDACGGRVTVSSAEGRGSEFHVWLPLAEAPADVGLNPQARSAVN